MKAIENQLALPFIGRVGSYMSPPKKKGSETRKPPTPDGTGEVGAATGAATATMVAEPTATPEA